MQDQTYNRNSSDQGRNKKEKGNWKKRNNQGEGSNSSPKEQQNSGDNDRNAVHNKDQIPPLIPIKTPTREGIFQKISLHNSPPLSIAIT